MERYKRPVKAKVVRDIKNTFDKENPENYIYNPVSKTENRDH